MARVLQLICIIFILPRNPQSSYRIQHLHTVQQSFISFLMWKRLSARKIIVGKVSLINIENTRPRGVDSKCHEKSFYNSEYFAYK